MSNQLPTSHTQDVHIVSDSSAASAMHIFSAAIARFKGQEDGGHIHRHVLVRGEAMQDRVVQQIKERPGVVFYTFGSDLAARRFKDRLSAINNPAVVACDVMDAPVRALERFFGRPPEDHVGDLETDETSALQEEAVAFFHRHDDGKTVSDVKYRPELIGRSDVVVLAISRGGKTPTCLAMAHSRPQPLKAANIPLTYTVTELHGEYEAHPSNDGYFEAILEARKQSKGPYWVGLIVDPEVVAIHRANRIKRGSGGDHGPRQFYDNLYAVEAEMRAAQRFFGRLGIDTIRTHGLSVEEVAGLIIGRQEKHRAKQLDAV